MEQAKTAPKTAQNRPKITYFEPFSLSEIGETLGISKQAVFQILKKSLRKMRVEMVRRGIAEELGYNPAQLLRRTGS